jgi:hypothetical protein
MSMKNSNDTIGNRTRDLEYIRELDLILWKFYRLFRLFGSLRALSAVDLHVIMTVIVLDLQLLVCYIVVCCMDSGYCHL